LLGSRVGESIIEWKVSTIKPPALIKREHQMKLKELIKKLTTLENEHKDRNVIVDFETFAEGEGHGYYNLEEVQVVVGADKETFINLKSSNEA
jgi:hypothetical protein